MLFERAEYWEERRGRHFTRSIKNVRTFAGVVSKIEADLRKAEKTIAQSQKYLTMWRAESLDLNMAKLISSHDHISACFPLDTYPRPAEKASMKSIVMVGRMMTSSPRSRPAKLRSAVMNGRFSINNAGLTTIRTA
ncbi:hypothetical protein BANRA_04877 [Escherichia coli]|nr:hypothetical protein BANRA_04877 [Escherichia coli]